ncbi:hypothetical protein EJG51_002415 [Undibacterium piscinae]|uniref:Uncharacterized protein n=1 Tax=Undibacterium piscinae TaxID=2495591 RepID=A0A6M4A1A5_9BURK|nr:hypothetical protein EJG51_002415 [Undibacterium piscinae]
MAAPARTTLKRHEGRLRMCYLSHWSHPLRMLQLGFDASDAEESIGIMAR